MMKFGLPNQKLMEHVSTSSVRQKSAAKTILFTGFVVGTLDAIAAIVVYNANPSMMFRFIASGAFGKEAAFSGGEFMIAMGILFHYFIATLWTLLYFMIYPKLRMLPGNKYMYGIFYGAFIWMIMNLVVLPLSQIKTGALYLDQSLVGISILIFMVGLPIAALVHRHYTR
jgi:hypothetical protein